MLVCISSVTPYEGTLLCVSHPHPWSSELSLLRKPDPQIQCIGLNPKLASWALLLGAGIVTERVIETERGREILSLCLGDLGGELWLNSRCWGLGSIWGLREGPVPGPPPWPVAAYLSLCLFILSSCYLYLPLSLKFPFLWGPQSFWLRSCPGDLTVTGLPL